MSGSTAKAERKAEDAAAVENGGLQAAQLLVIQRLAALEATRVSKAAVENVQMGAACDLRDAQRTLERLQKAAGA